MAHDILRSASERFLTTPYQLPSADRGAAWSTPVSHDDPRIDEPALTCVEQAAIVAEGFLLPIGGALFGVVAALAARGLGIA